ncbi:hypothetical protein QQY84_03470 [Streptococcus suis]|uniref:hypothetical protein n=1 Tax=Streptococcus suis TaxID=1307 RepID=UPI000D0B3BB0|nr:hypothetical protein [Streptococcus suis]MBS7854664.1 hypothetical protein [Streptococcus suis]MBS7977723.1 hypothetical protein [Streptococcus suis]MDG3109186.1 hypothetical protein [Streptococcus suis]MDG3148011.1 hypothetical protein [Streptococcus suis]MDG3170331.1 hypothetical protein [Streptococcus suis]
MDTKQFMEVVNEQINKNFNVDNELVEYVVSELNQMNTQITQEQAQHIVNIIEYVSKSTSKSTVVTITNALLELGVLKAD